MNKQENNSQFRRTILSIYIIEDKYISILCHYQAKLWSEVFMGISFHTLTLTTH